MCVCVCELGWGGIQQAPGANRLSVKLCNPIQIQPPYVAVKGLVTAYSLSSSLLSFPLLSSPRYRGPIITC